MLTGKSHWGALAIVLSAVAWLGTGWVSAQHWEAVPLRTHAEYQAVTVGGAPLYDGGWPVRLRGIVLNDPADWLEPAPAYNEIPFDLGGQWEIFVQAAEPGDFGGTAAWIGQCYGNLPFLGDPFFSYSDTEWLGEMDRLNFPNGAGTPPLRAGDLVELRARKGSSFQGKTNVNENHSKAPENDFDVVILAPGYGLPTPAELTLADLFEADGFGGWTFIWDPTRATGGERYQAERIRIQGVRLAADGAWGRNTDTQLVDRLGRVLPVRLGNHMVFAASPPPQGYFHLTGILNQSSFTGVGGYYLVALHRDAFVCGDFNCDGLTNFGDISPFILALKDPTGYVAAYPDCYADFSGSGTVTFADLSPFIDAMKNGGRCR
ncbi:MAG: hypothetical protein IPM18_17815 [Phycisphaerales bacterium]|nr:hypothetical protein [Phycisphaerales bacterium]